MDLPELQVCGLCLQMHRFEHLNFVLMLLAPAGFILGLSSSNLLMPVAVKQG
jgi:hypothetical protein